MAFPWRCLGSRPNINLQSDTTANTVTWLRQHQFLSPPLPRYKMQFDGTLDKQVHSKLKFLLITISLSCSLFAGRSANLTPDLEAFNYLIAKVTNQLGLLIIRRERLDVTVTLVYIDCWVWNAHQCTAAWTLVLTCGFLSKLT